MSVAEACREAGTKPNFSDIARRYGVHWHTVAKYLREGADLDIAARGATVNMTRPHHAFTCKSHTPAATMNDATGNDKKGLFMASIPVSASRTARRRSPYDDGHRSEAGRFRMIPRALVRTRSFPSARGGNRRRFPSPIRLIAPFDERNHAKLQLP